jgi:hypothetical protein
MAAQTPEGRVKRKTTELLRQYGLWYFYPGNNGFGKSGIPDIIAIVRGTFVGIECKADKSKKPTALQLGTGAQIRDAGALWFLVYDEESLQLLELYIRERLADVDRGESAGTGA